ncbi:MAG: SDR family oxidoreductase [Candidatus Binatia bacterium]
MKGTALVTGASAGLGRDYARLFAADGHDVVLVARRRERLEELAREIGAKNGVQTHVLPLDLGDREAPRRCAEELRARGVAIDFLVNNAGLGTNGAFAESDPAKQLEMIQVNVTTLVELTRLLLPDMIARKRGRVLNVGSTAGFQAGPFMAVYYASKAFVNSFSEALAYELDGTGVTVTVSCPGATETEFAGHAGNDSSLLFKLGAADSMSVAREGYAAMMAGRRMVVHGVTNRLGVQALRVSPRAVVIGLAARLNRG